MFEGRLALTVAEAAETLGISVNHAYLLAKRGEIPTVWLGKRRVVPRKELMEYLSNAAYCCLKPSNGKDK